MTNCDNVMNVRLKLEGSCSSCFPPPHHTAAAAAAAARTSSIYRFYYQKIRLDQETSVQKRNEL